MRLHTGGFAFKIVDSCRVDHPRLDVSGANAMIVAAKKARKFWA